MLPTRLWRCELRRFVICSAVSGGVLVFGCLPGERATLFLCFLTALSRARCVLTSVFLSYTFCFFFLLCCVFPRYLRLFCSCLRYFVVVDGSLCPLIDICFVS